MATSCVYPRQSITIVNPIWRDGEVHIQEVDPRDPESRSYCTAPDGKAWATLRVPPEAVPPWAGPGVVNQRPMPGLQSSAPALSGNWLVVAFRTYPAGTTAEDAHAVGQWRVYARHHDPYSDSCNGWDDHWVDLGVPHSTDPYGGSSIEQSTAPTAVPITLGGVDGTLILMTGGSDPGSTRMRVLLDDGSTYGVTSDWLPLVDGYDMAGVGYVSGRIAAASSSGYVTLVSNATINDRQVSLFVLSWQQINGMLLGSPRGPIFSFAWSALPGTANGLSFSYCNISAPVLTRLGNQWIGAILADAVCKVGQSERVPHTLTFLLDRASGTSGPPNRIQFLDMSPDTESFAVGMDASISDGWSGADRVSIPHETLPVLVSQEWSASLYTFSRWDSTVSQLIIPPYSMSYTDTVGWVVPFQQEGEQGRVLPAPGCIRYGVSFPQ